MVLKTSPTAIGVVVCWRISRKPSWSSAGIGSSIQNRWYGSRRLPSRAASIGRQPVVHVVQQVDVVAELVAEALEQRGTKCRYASVLQPMLRTTPPFSAGSYGLPPRADAVRAARPGTPHCTRIAL